jgi:hypothetical protein
VCGRFGALSAGGGVGRDQLGRPPLLAASAAFLAGAFLGCSCSFWLALCAGALACALVRPVRFAALGLALGLLRGGLQPRPTPFALPEEFEGEVAGSGAVRVTQGLVALHLRGVPVHRGDRALFAGKTHVPPPLLNPGGRDRRAALLARGIAVEGSAEVVRVLERGPALYRWIDELRERFTERALLLCTSRERGALVAALGVGDRRKISRPAGSSTCSPARDCISPRWCCWCERSDGAAGCGRAGRARCARRRWAPRSPCPSRSAKCCSWERPGRRCARDSARRSGSSARRWAAARTG